MDVGSKVIVELARLGKVHRRTVQQAGFLVLKSPDIPSMLVETAFISNPDEERKLRNPAHQELVDLVHLGLLLVERLQGRGGQGEARERLAYGCGQARKAGGTRRKRTLRAASFLDSYIRVPAASSSRPGAWRSSPTW